MCGLIPDQHQPYITTTLSYIGRMGVSVRNDVIICPPGYVSHRLSRPAGGLRPSNS